MALIPVPICKYCGKPIFVAKRKDTCLHKECRRKMDKNRARLRYQKNKVKV